MAMELIKSTRNQPYFVLIPSEQCSRIQGPNPKPAAPVELSTDIRETNGGHILLSEAARTESEKPPCKLKVWLQSCGLGVGENLAKLWGWSHTVAFSSCASIDEVPWNSPQPSCTFPPLMIMQRGLHFILNGIFLLSGKALLWLKIKVVISWVFTCLGQGLVDPVYSQLSL